MMQLIYKMSRWALGLTTVVSFAACNSFLDKVPDDRNEMKEPENIAELLTSGYPNGSYVKLYELVSDNVYDRGNEAYRDILADKQIFTFKTVTSIYQDTPTYFWSTCYENIAVANQALQSLESMPKTEENDGLRGEALMIRAYNGFMLAHTFAAPYDPATVSSQLGLPMPIEPETVVLKEYKRGTLKELYDTIISDFEEGFKLLRNDYSQPKFHFNPTAAAAFGARLYRVLGEWDKVIEYGKIAMGDAPASKLHPANTSYQSYSYSECKQKWCDPNEDYNFLVHVAMSNWTRHYASNRFGITPATRNMLTFNNNFFGNNVSIAVRVFGREASLNVPKHYEYFQYTNIAAGTGYVRTRIALFTGEEVAFNIAEAYAMKEDYASANQWLQYIASRWVNNYSATNPLYEVTQEKIENFYKEDTREFNPFYALNETQTAYVKAISDFKRACTLHEGMRFFDIRQYRLAYTHELTKDADKDQPVIEIKSGDPRYAFQLPSNVLGYNLEPNPGYTD